MALVTIPLLSLLPAVREDSMVRYADKVARLVKEERYKIEPWTYWYMVEDAEPDYDKSYRNCLREMPDWTRRKTQRTPNQATEIVHSLG